MCAGSAARSVRKCVGLRIGFYNVRVSEGRAEGGGSSSDSWEEFIIFSYQFDICLFFY